MSKEKQIEAMAKDLQETHDYEGCDAWHCDGCKYEKYNGNYLCESIMQAERLIAKGYRKQSENTVDVIRCKDCKFNVANMEKDPLDITDYSGEDIVCSYFMTDGLEPTDFCSYAKMKGGAE